MSHKFSLPVEEFFAGGDGIDSRKFQPYSDSRMIRQPGDVVAIPSNPEIKMTVDSFYQQYSGGPTTVTVKYFDNNGELKQEKFSDESLILIREQ